MNSSLDLFFREEETRLYGSNDFVQSIQDIDRQCREIWPCWAYSSPKRLNINSKKKNVVENDFKPVVIQNNTNTEIDPKGLRIEKNNDGLIGEVEDLKDEIQRVFNSIHISNINTPIPKLVEADPFKPVGMEEISLENVSEIVPPTRSKKKLQRDIIKLSYTLRDYRNENNTLQLDLLRAKEEFVKSQKIISQLKKELKKSDLVLNELIKQEKKSK